MFKGEFEMGNVAYICPKCKSTYFGEENAKGKCPKCDVWTVDTKIKETDWKSKSQEEKDNIKNAISSVDKIMVTTGNDFQGYTIVEYKEIVFGEIVVPNGLLGLVTTGTYFVSSALEKARQMAIDAMKVNASNCGANGIIAVDVDVSSIQANAVMVSANGTAVLIKKNNYKSE